MPVCSIVKLLPLRTVDDLMHYGTWPSASCNRSSTTPKGNSFDYTTNRHEITVYYHECEGGIENLSQGSPIGIRRLVERYQMVIAKEVFFYPILTQIMDSFSCSPLSATFYIGKTRKRLQENPECAEVQHGGVILTLQ